jgi:hypothetical protein
MSPLPVCASPCPEAPEVTCRLGLDNHLEHFGGDHDQARTWPNTAYVPPEASVLLTGAAKSKAELTEMARRLRAAE